MNRREFSRAAAAALLVSPSSVRGRLRRQPTLPPPRMDAELSDEALGDDY